LAFHRKYQGKGLYRAFAAGETWYLYPRDELLAQALPIIGSTQSWREGEAYSFPSLSSEMRTLPESYRISGNTNSPSRVRVARRHHPLLNQEFEVLKANKQTLVIRLADGSALKIPRAWTDATGISSGHNTLPMSVFAVNALRELAYPPQISRQCMRPPQLAEEHGDKLAAASKATRLIFASVVKHTLFEFVPWKEL
jgi:hypothetical protein